jgi:hypothetical protein
MYSLYDLHIFSIHTYYVFPHNDTRRKKYCGFYHYCWMYFVFANTHLFFLRRFTKIYTSVYCMTILGKLSCLQEAFIYIIVQTVSLKKKLHICHSWVIIDIFFTCREFPSSLFYVRFSGQLFGFSANLHVIISSNLSNFYVFCFRFRGENAVQRLEKRNLMLFSL